MAIQSISQRYGGYNYNPEDTCRAKSIKRNRVMKIQHLHDRGIRLMTSHFLWTLQIDIKEFEMFLFICFEADYIVLCSVINLKYKPNQTLLYLILHFLISNLYVCKIVERIKWYRTKKLIINFCFSPSFKTSFFTHYLTTLFESSYFDSYCPMPPPKFNMDITVLPSDVLLLRDEPFYELVHKLADPIEAKFTWSTRCS